MNLNDGVGITVHRGIVGSAIVVQAFFKQEKPDYVILAAAKVGGIHANYTYPADFIYQNMMIEANVINSANISHINVGTGKDVTIREMAETMKEVVGYKGNLAFDIAKSDGSPRKLIDVSRLSNMGWKYSTDLVQGLKKTYKYYLKQVGMQ
jgi:nucleoside-diphosphate-sugar epimerase